MNNKKTATQIIAGLEKSIRAAGPVVLKLGSLEPAGFSGDPAKGGGSPGEPE